ncbi:uncharacterized protein LOC117644674 [Thrips palmi]|uniref:Uncharacterized protein LOC117644674 n=1 Tax=Thrips palmi TaxID=161013 RepID=A0A6P8YSW0_THRPL|nr:uncharacterized protein LOC117644674 [Thrips palmi]
MEANGPVTCPVCWLHAAVAAGVSSPQEDEDLDADSFQEQFLLETPPVGSRLGFIAIPDESDDEEAARTPLRPSAPPAPSLLVAEKRAISAREHKMDQMGAEFKSPTSPEEEKGAADEKHAEHRKDVDRLTGGVGDEDEASTSDAKKHTSRSTSPVSRVAQTPPTLELVIGHKKVRTRDASASSESRVTLYGSQDVEISIRSESHISVTRRESTSTSAPCDADVTEETETTVRRAPAQRSKAAYKDQSSPESSGIFILPSKKDRKREETVLFSGEESVYRYDQGDAIVASVDSPGTDESASHLITDTGISLTRGTTETSPALQPARGRVDRDEEAEESELTDAGLSPIQPDDIGLPVTDMKFYDEEVTLVSFAEMGTSPHDYHIESSSVALSPIEIPTSEASVYTDSIDTKDAGVSPIGSDDESLKQLSSLSASAPIPLESDSYIGNLSESIGTASEFVRDVDRTGGANDQGVETQAKTFRSELVINVGADEAMSATKDLSPPKQLGPKVKELQKVFSESIEKDDVKRVADDDSEEENLSSHPGVFKIVEEIEDSLGTPKHARRSSSKDSPPRDLGLQLTSQEESPVELTEAEEVLTRLEHLYPSSTAEVPGGQGELKKPSHSVTETTISKEIAFSSTEQSSVEVTKIEAQRESTKFITVETVREDIKKEDLLASSVIISIDKTTHEISQVGTTKQETKTESSSVEQNLTTAVDAMEKLRETVIKGISESSGSEKEQTETIHVSHAETTSSHKSPTEVKDSLLAAQETLQRIQQTLDATDSSSLTTAAGAQEPLQLLPETPRDLETNLASAKETLERIQKSLDDRVTERRDDKKAPVGRLAPDGSPEVLSPSAQVEEDSASTESSATLSVLEVKSEASTHRDTVGPSIKDAPNVDESLDVGFGKKDPGDPRPRSLQKGSDNVVTERDVSDLMSEVAECTRQIKQEVRQLKPDLTPTPEGADLGTLNLALARATGMSLIPEVTSQQASDSPSTKGEVAEDVDVDTRPRSSPDEPTVLSSNVGTGTPSESTPDVDPVLESLEAVNKEKVDEGSEKGGDLADGIRVIESELRSALIVGVAVGQSMAVDAASISSKDTSESKGKTYVHLVKGEKDKVNDVIKGSGDKEIHKSILSVLPDLKVTTDQDIASKFDEKLDKLARDTATAAEEVDRAQKEVQDSIADAESAIKSLKGDSFDIMSPIDEAQKHVDNTNLDGKILSKPVQLDTSTVRTVTQSLLDAERGLTLDKTTETNSQIIEETRRGKDELVAVGNTGSALAQANLELQKEKDVKDQKVKKEMLKAAEILQKETTDKTDEQIIIEVEEILEKDIEMPAGDSQESTPEARHKIRGKVKEAKRAVGGFFGSLMGRSRDSDSEQESSDSQRHPAPKKSKKKKREKDIKEEVSTSETVEKDAKPNTLPETKDTALDDRQITQAFLKNETEMYEPSRDDLLFADDADEQQKSGETVKAQQTEPEEQKQDHGKHKKEKEPKKKISFFGALRGKSKDSDEKEQSMDTSSKGAETKHTETQEKITTENERQEQEKQLPNLDADIVTDLKATQDFLQTEQKLYVPEKQGHTDERESITVTPDTSLQATEIIDETHDKDKKTEDTKIKVKEAKKSVSGFFGSLLSKSKESDEPEADKESEPKKTGRNKNENAEGDGQDTDIRAPNGSEKESLSIHIETTKTFLANEQSAYVKETNETKVPYLEETKVETHQKKEETEKIGKEKQKELKKPSGGFFGSLLGKGREATDISQKDKKTGDKSIKKQGGDITTQHTVIQAEELKQKQENTETTVSRDIQTISETSEIPRTQRESPDQEQVAKAMTVSDTTDDTKKNRTKDNLEKTRMFLTNEQESYVKDETISKTDKKDHTEEVITGATDSVEHEKDELGKKSKSKVKDAKKAVGGFFGSLMGKGKEAVDTVSEKVEETAKDASESVTAEVADLSQKVEDKADKVKAASSEVATDVKDAAEAVTDGVKSGVETAVTAVDDVVTGAEKAVDETVEEGKELVHDVKDSVVEAKDHTVEALTAAKDSVEHEKDELGKKSKSKVKDAKKAVGGFFGSLMGKGKEAVDTVSEKVEETAKDASESVAAEVADLSQKVEDKADKVKAASSEVATDVKDAAEAVTDGVKSGVETAVTAVDDAVTGAEKAVDETVEEGKELVHDVKDSVVEAKDHTVEALTAAKDSVEHEKDELGKKSKSKVKDAKKAVGGFFGSLMGKGKEAVDTVSEKVEETAKDASESVTAEVADLSQKVEDKADKVKAASSEVATDVKDAAEAVTDGVKSGVETAVTAVDDAVTGAEKAVDETVEEGKELVHDVKDSVVEAKDHTVEALTAAKDSVEHEKDELGKKSKSKVKDAKKAVGGFFGSLMGKGKEAVDTVSEKVEETAKDASESVTAEVADLSQKVEDKADKVKAASSEVATDVKDAAEAVTDGVKSGVETAVTAVDDAVTGAEKAVDETVEEGKELVHDVKDSVVEAKDHTVEALTAAKDSVEHEKDELGKKSKSKVKDAKKAVGGFFGSLMGKGKEAVDTVSEKVEETAKDASESVTAEVADLSQKVEDKADKVKAASSEVATDDAAEAVTDGVKSGVETAVTAVDDAVTGAEKAVDETVEEGKELVHDVKDSVVEAKDHTVEALTAAKDSVEHEKDELGKKSKSKVKDAKKAVGGFFGSLMGKDGVTGAEKAVDETVEEGKELVHDVKDSVVEAKDHTVEALTAAKDSVEHEKDELGKKSKSKVKDAKKAVGGFFGSLMGKGKEAVDTVSEKVEETAKDASESVAAEVADLSQKVEDKADKVKAASSEVATDVKDAAEAVTDGVKSGVETAVTAVDDAVTGAEKAVDETVEEGKELVHDVKDSVVEAKDHTVEALTAAKDSVEHEKDELGKKSKSKVKDAKKAVGGFFGSLMGKGKEAVDTVSEKVEETAKDASESVTAEVADLSQKVEDKADKVKAASSEVATDVKDAAEAVTDGVKSGVETAVTAVDDAVTGAEKAVDETVEDGKQLVHDVKDSVVEAKDHTVEALTAAKDSVEHEKDELGKKSKSKVKDAKKAVGGFFGSLMGKGKEAVDTVSEKVEETAKDASESVTAEVADLSQKVEDKADKVKAASSEVATDVKDAAEAVTDGVKSGVETAVTAADKAVAGAEKVLDYSEMEHHEIASGMKYASDSNSPDIFEKVDDTSAIIDVLSQSGIGGQITFKTSTLSQSSGMSVKCEVDIAESLIERSEVISSTSESVLPSVQRDRSIDSDLVLETCVKIDSVTHVFESSSHSSGERVIISSKISHMELPDIVSSKHDGGSYGTALNSQANENDPHHFDAFDSVTETSMSSTFVKSSLETSSEVLKSSSPIDHVASSSQMALSLDRLGSESTLPEPSAVSPAISSSPVHSEKHDSCEKPVLEEIVVPSRLIGVESLPADSGCEEPVCVQKIIKKPPVDELLDDLAMDLSEFRVVGKDELHHSSRKISPVHSRSPRDLTSVDSAATPVVADEELCVRRVARELDDSEHESPSVDTVSESEKPFDKVGDGFKSPLDETAQFLAEERRLYQSVVPRSDEKPDIGEMIVSITPSALELDFVAKEAQELQSEKKSGKSSEQVASPKKSPKTSEVVVTEQLEKEISLTFSEPVEKNVRLSKMEQSSSLKSQDKPEQITLLLTKGSVSESDIVTSSTHIPPSIGFSGSHHKDDTIQVETQSKGNVVRTSHISSITDISLPSDTVESKVKVVTELTGAEETSLGTTAPIAELDNLIVNQEILVVDNSQGSAGLYSSTVYKSPASETAARPEGIAFCLDTAAEEASSDVTDVSITTVSEAAETGSSFEISDTSIDRDSLTGAGESTGNGDSSVLSTCRIVSGEMRPASRISCTFSSSQDIDSERDSSVRDIDVLSGTESNEHIEEDIVSTQGLLTEAHDTDQEHSWVRTEDIISDDAIEITVRENVSTQASDNSEDSSDLTTSHGIKKETQPLSHVLMEEGRQNFGKKKTEFTSLRTQGKDSAEKVRHTRQQTSKPLSSGKAAVSRDATTSRKVASSDAGSKKSTLSLGKDGVEKSSTPKATKTISKKTSLTETGKDYVSPYRQTSRSESVPKPRPMFHYMQSTKSRDAKLEKEASEVSRTQSQASSREGSPLKKPAVQQYKQAAHSRPSSVSSTSSSVRRVSESSSASSTRSSVTRTKVLQPASTSTTKTDQKSQKEVTRSATSTRTHLTSRVSSVEQSKSSTVLASSQRTAKKTIVAVTEPSKIQRRAIPSQTSTKTKVKPSKTLVKAEEQVPSVDVVSAELESPSVLTESTGPLSSFPESPLAPRRAASAPIPSTKDNVMNYLHPRLQTSLPSSPSKLARASQQGLVTQLLTSEVFTRTVESTEAVEVVYHQPERQRRPTDGEQSFIDTTDSSLSESTAIPSSSTSSDRRRSRSTSPKASKRSDVVSSVDTAETVREPGNTDDIEANGCLEQNKPVGVCRGRLLESQGGVDASKTQPTTLEGSLEEVAEPNAESKRTSQDASSIPSFTGEGSSPKSLDGLNRQSVVEETIVKAAVNPVPSRDSNGKYDKEVDKKKEKKEKEKEEKERKKKEKKERELKEKEEKDRKEREKKERKEQEKREKEERQRREKEEKRNKTLKEKADKEKMEKEKKIIAKNPRFEKEGSIENKGVVEDIFVKATKDSPQVSQTSFVVVRKVDPASVAAPAESHGSVEVVPTSQLLAKQTKDDTTTVNDVEQQQKERALHASFVRTTSLIDTKALIDNEQAHSLAQHGPARALSLQSATHESDKLQSSPSQEQIKNSEPKELQTSDVTIPSESNTADVPNKRHSSFDKGTLSERVRETSQDSEEHAHPDSVLPKVIQQEKMSLGSAEETHQNISHPVVSTTARIQSCNDAILENSKGSEQSPTPRVDLNISGITRDIEEIISTAAAAVKQPAQSHPPATSIILQGSIPEDIQSENTPTGVVSEQLTEVTTFQVQRDLLEKRSVGKVEEIAALGKVQETHQYQGQVSSEKSFVAPNPIFPLSSETEKRVTFDVPQDAKNCTGSKLTNDTIYATDQKDREKLEEETTTGTLLPEKNVTSQVTTTFKTEKVPVEPGKPPHVVNTVTEKVVSPTGVPEQVVTTVTDKKFFDSGRPDQVTTTITEKKFSETGRPDQVTTTVTEKVFTEMGAPTQIIKTTVTEKMSLVDGKPTEIVKTVETDSPLEEMVTFLSGSTDMLQKSQPLLADLSDDQKQTVHSFLKGADSLPSDSFTTVTTERTVAGPDGKTATVRTQKIFTTEESFDVPLLDEEFLRETPKVTVVTKETTTITSSGAPESTSQDSAPPKEFCYVTTPTMQRRAHSQRRTGEERPLPIDVSYLQDDNSDDEEYIVTEPQEDDRNVEDRYRINSSPEILHLPHSVRETRRLSPDPNRVKFQLGSLDSQDSVSSDPTTPITPSAKVHKFTVERVEEESIGKAIPESSSTAMENSESQPTDAAVSDKKLRRVERHFERMASQSLAEGTTPVRDVDFQRVVSQLSQEEVALSEDEYENLLAQVTTPSDEWDSQGGTDDSPEERTARQFADGLGVGQDGSVAQPLSSYPLPTPSHLDKDDSDPDSEPAIQENIKSYSERRAFWEQKASSGSGETPLTTPITTPGLTFEKSLQAAATVQTAPLPIPRQIRTESVDSEAEYLAQHGRNPGVENVAFNEEEPSAPRRPARMHSVDEYSETPPPVAVRKAIYERSISLPCTDVPDHSKRKRQFEDHLKKEMVAENLMQQLEEEAVPEHKDLPHRSFSEDPEDSLLSDEAFDTEVCSDVSSVKDLALGVDKKQSLEGYMRETAEALVEETMHNAEAIVHRAEEHVIQDPEEEVLEWHGVQDLKNRFEGVATQDTDRRGRENNLDEKTNTELRRESLARTHEITSSKLAEVMQYKGENLSKPSDSLEVHVDKSETEDTEKSRDLDDDIRELERQRRADSRVSSADSKGTRGPGDHQSQSSSEDTQCESDVTPEDQADGHSLYQPHQQIQDIVWEVGVQEQPEPLAEEFVQDILVPSGQLILQNGDYNDNSKEVLYNGSPASAHITEEEARKVAEELVQNIEEEVSKRNIESPIIETIRQIAEEKNLEKREIELMESLLAKKQRDQGHLFSRTDTTTSSMEITDEDLRSSGVEIDLSPTESQSGLYQCMDPRARQEDEKPEALRSEDIDLSDLKPDPIQIDDVPTNDKMHKHFSIIEESDECDTRSDQSDVKTDPSKKQKLNSEPIDELQQSLDAVNEELDEEFIVKSEDTTGNDFRSLHVAQIIEEEPTIECTFETFSTDCIPQGSPTGSTTSSGGKRTPPPKPERKFSAHREGREESTPEICLKLDRPVDRTSENFSIRAESTESQKSSSQDDRSPLSSGDAAKEISDGSGVVRRHASRPEAESSSSGERSGGLHPDRRSGADFDPYSSSSESHYQSFEQSYSRPCSSDVEGLLALTTGSSEYESAIASTRSVTSTEYQTAVSSLSSRESMKSLDSESSGHLASIEVSSEASETLVPSGTDLDDMDDSSINLALDEDLDRRMQEHCDLSRVSTLQSDSRTGKLPSTEISDDDAEDTRDQIETDEEDEIPHIMKRSHEMTFNADTKARLTGRSESSTDAPEDKLASSMDGDTGSVLSMSISSASETVAVKTIIELSRTDSDKMDASGTSELLTASATSQEMSYSSESREEPDDTLAAPTTPRTIDSGTSTPTHQRDTTVSSVTLTTTSVAENGIQSASTQVTSETTSSTSEPPRRSHRRNESTSNFSSFIPPKPASDFDVNTTIKECTVSESAESEVSFSEQAISRREADDTDKKSVDEQLEESYQTEADQAFHREAREGRYLSDDVEPELEQLDGSRPHSQVSKSDSESGHRAVSSGFSDERADSELAEVLRQGSSDTACEDPIDRPLTPEPAEEVQIKPDVAEFSSEALASLSGLDLEYSQAHAFSRTVEYASHVSPLKEKPCVAWEHGGEHEEEMAEAEAAFHMVPHHSPHHGPHHHHPMPETIIEDDDAENNELAAREAALQEQIRRREEHMRSISPANIPDITVTEHMAAILDKDYLYPDLEKDDDEVVEEPVNAMTSVGQQAVPDKKVTSEMESVTESPTSESFEMLEKPDPVEERSEDADDFVMIEEVGREVQESDSEGQGVRISSASIPIRKRESMPDEEEEFIAQSPPPLTRRIMDVKYYGEGGVLADEDDPFRFDTGHGPLDESYEENPPEEEFETEADVEAGKKWIEMQFGGEEPAAVTTGYNYEMDFERGPLEDIKEEDEMGTSSKIGSLGSQKESVGSFGSGSVKESLSSTPEYDVLAGKKYFTRSGEHDDISMSSLQEFESLETQVALDAAHRRMVGSQDSLNGVTKKRVAGDDISLASLADFEKMERACVEAERIEVRARVEEAMLSEIDEGHESQVSDSDETISGAAMKTIGDSDSDDYDKRMFEIDEIIRQAQSNVERFDKPGRVSGGPESFGRGDSLEEVARVPDLEYDAPISLVTSTDSLELRSKCPDSMVTSADSLEVKVSPSPQMLTSTDSIELQQQLKTPLKADIMTDSIELPTDPSHLITSSDSLELETTLERGPEAEDEDASLAGRGSIRSGTGSLYDRSSSSGRDGDLSSLSAQGACARIDPAMLGSTDSLEPTSSTATHATYQYETDSNMSSSFTSGGSNTMVSSTETLEASASMGAEGVWYDETFVEGGPYIRETLEASDDPEYSHVIRRVVQSAPEIRKVTFRGPSADAAMKNLVEQFGPGDQTVETQHVDPDGNVHISRVVQHRVVVQGEVPRTDLTGPELEDYLQRHGMTETDLTTLLASTSSSSQPGAVVATTQQRLTTSHLTGEGAAGPAVPAAPTPVRRPPPPHDISVDDEPEYDVREHDWRFNLQHSAEAPEDEEADSVEEKQ